MKFVLSLVAALVLALGVAAATRGEPVPPSEKCDLLQDRCLHRENGICQIWHDECLRSPQARRGSAGGRGSKKHLGGRRHHV